MNRKGTIPKRKIKMITKMNNPIMLKRFTRRGIVMKKDIKILAISPEKIFIVSIDEGISKMKQRNQQKHKKYL